MIVAAEDGGRVGQDGGFKDFAHMHDTRRQAADGDGIDPDGRVFAVQQDDHEMFAVHGAEVLPEQRGGVCGAPEARGWGRDGRLTDQGDTVHGDAVGTGTVVCSVTHRLAGGRTAGGGMENRDSCAIATPSQAAAEGARPPPAPTRLLPLAVALLAGEPVAGPRALRIAALLHRDAVEGAVP